MQVKVLGAERRRRWSYDEKVRLVEETLQTGETVCGVARRHGVAYSLLFTWRRQARRGCLGGDSGAALVPVEITAGPPVSTSESQPASSPPQRAKIGIIEILVVRFHGRAGIAETDSTYEALSHFMGFDTPLSLESVCPNFRVKQLEDVGKGGNTGDVPSRLTNPPLERAQGQVPQPSWAQTRPLHPVVRMKRKVF